MEMAREVVARAAEKMQGTAGKPAITFAKHPHRLRDAFSTNASPASPYDPAPSRHPSKTRWDQKPTPLPKNHPAREIIARAASSAMEVVDAADASRRAPTTSSGEDVPDTGGEWLLAGPSGKPVKLQKNGKGLKDNRQPPLQSREPSQAGKPALKRTMGPLGQSIPTSVEATTPPRDKTRASSLAAAGMPSPPSSCPWRMPAHSHASSPHPSPSPPRSYAQVARTPPSSPTTPPLILELDPEDEAAAHLSPVRPQDLAEETMHHDEDGDANQQGFGVSPDPSQSQGSQNP